MGWQFQRGPSSTTKQWSLTTLPSWSELSKSSGIAKKECCQDSSPSVTLGSDVGWWKKQLLPQRWGLGSEFWCAPQIQSVWRGVGGGFGGGRDGNSIKVRGELKSHLWWTYAKFWQVGGDWIANQVDTWERKREIFGILPERLESSMSLSSIFWMFWMSFWIARLIGFPRTFRSAKRLSVVVVTVMIII